MDSTAIGGKDHLEVTGVSRCGRVRKKSSKLVDFQSPDDIEAEKVHRRSNKSHRSPAHNDKTAKRPPPPPPPTSSIRAYFQPAPRFQRLAAQQAELGTPTATDREATPELEPITTDRDLDLLSSLTKFDEDDEHVDNNNDVDSDDYELVVDQTVRNSAYMSEKKSKKSAAYGDGKGALSRTQRKDKGKPRFTAYMLWSKDVRQEMFRSNPDLSFSQVSRRLSQMWANVPSNEKHVWRRRAKRVTVKTKKAQPTGDKLPSNYLNKSGPKKPGRKPKALLPPPPPTTKTTTMRPTKTTKSTTPQDALKPKQSAKKSSGWRSEALPSSIRTPSPSKRPGQSRKTASSTGLSSRVTIAEKKCALPGTDVIDVAAHLKLLGDNLTIIGQRLKEHEGQIAVSGSLSVLLDSLLCSLAPLMCLTTLIHGVDKPKGHLKDMLVNTLDNIAYVMPGL